MISFLKIFGLVLLGMVICKVISYSSLGYDELYSMKVNVPSAHYYYYCKSRNNGSPPEWWTIKDW